MKFAEIPPPLPFDWRFVVTFPRIVSNSFSLFVSVIITPPTASPAYLSALAPLITEILSIEFISTLGACSMPHSWSSSLTSLFMITILLLCKPFITGFDK